jgi:hypothetical protein
LSDPHAGRAGNAEARLAVRRWRFLPTGKCMSIEIPHTRGSVCPFPAFWENVLFFWENFFSFKEKKIRADREQPHEQPTLALSPRRQGHFGPVATPLWAEICFFFTDGRALNPHPSSVADGVGGQNRPSLDGIPGPWSQGIFLYFLFFIVAGVLFFSQKLKKIIVFSLFFLSFSLSFSLSLYTHFGFF